MISLVINCDTRPGCGDEVNTTGDHGEGSLNGVRSWDFLSDGVTNKLNFFKGHDVEVILFVDEHDPIPEEVREKIEDIDQLDYFVCKPHDRTHPRWNEQIYVDALKLAHGKYIAHFDGDCVAFRREDSSIVERHLAFLDGPFSFVCQPTTLEASVHGMTWASTRFFMCRGDMLNLDELEKCVRNEIHRSRYGFCPALEHVLGGMAGENGVWYPPADWDEWMVFSWSRYHRGLLAKLNAMSYNEARDYILSCGIHGPNDVISKPLA